MFKIFKSNKAFSLIGIIVTIFVVSVGLMGILGLSSSSLKGASLSKNRLIASGLAQEGIEVIRNIRKLNTEWDDWYNSIVNGDYRVQYDSSALMAFSETPLKLDPASGLYQYDSGENSIFYRKITLTKISDYEIKVVVELKWLLKGDQRILTVEDRLWNWK
jgi:type II secretory pathway pseudopilin PulG